MYNENGKEYKPRRVDSFAASFCLCVNGIKAGGVILGENVAELEGQYGYNNGMYAFVAGGQMYVTPYVDGTKELLEDAGFVNKGIFVPFSPTPYTSFPGALGYDDEYKLWVGHLNNPAQIIIDYYYTIAAKHTSFNRWCNLLDRSGFFGRDSKAKDIFLKHVLHGINKDREGYNNWVREEVARIQSEKEHLDTHHM